MDWMFRLTPELFLAGEVIYDEYGLRRPGYSLDDIDWGRSLYNRQLNKGVLMPLTGWGYYVDLIGTRPRFDWSIGFGQFLPNPVGDLTHDTPVQRGTIQWAWYVRPGVDWYGGVLVENDIDGLEKVPRAKGVAYSSGIQIRF
jgi:hypothetical protein